MLRFYYICLLRLICTFQALFVQCKCWNFISILMQTLFDTAERNYMKWAAFDNVNWNVWCLPRFLFQSCSEFRTYIRLDRADHQQLSIHRKKPTRCEIRDCWRLFENEEDKRNGKHAGTLDFPHYDKRGWYCQLRAGHFLGNIFIPSQKLHFSLTRQ